MNDQARNLRHRLQTVKHHTPAKVISIVSGKGGVGKSNFALNYSLGLAQQGKKVLLFDLDIGMANVDILLGTHSKYHIVDMVEGFLPIWDIIERGPYQLSVIGGGSGLPSLFHLNEAKKNHFMKQLQNVIDQFEYIIFDMGAGATNDSLQFILASDETILVTTPEPTSITDAYAMIKYIHQRNRSLSISILVNRCETKTEGEEVALRMKQAARQFLRKEIVIKGFLPNDGAVLKAVKAQKPFLLHFPRSKVSIAIMDIIKSFDDNRTSVKETHSNMLQKLKDYFLQRS
jgi:flagellar biosynthesis protein FlhG